MVPSTSTRQTVRHWGDLLDCPFCSAEVTDPGAGFVDHLAESHSCADAFDDWREAVAGDIGGEWGG